MSATKPSHADRVVSSLELSLPFYAVLFHDPDGMELELLHRPRAASP